MHRSVKVEGPDSVKVHPQVVAELWAKHMNGTDSYTLSPLSRLHCPLCAAVVGHFCGLLCVPFHDPEDLQGNCFPKSWF